MKFSEQIKNIRKKKGFTQDQLAEELSITRQAVSNWENDRNLPDIEMLIIISETFNISLDQLILGGENMNNMTEKLIKDGSDTHKAKLNMISIAIGTGLLLIGIALIFIKAASVEYVDAKGILHENFFLIPISFLFLFGGFITFIVTGIRNTIYNIRDNSQKGSFSYIISICAGIILLGIGGVLILLAANSGAATTLAGILTASCGMILLATSIFLSAIKRKKDGPQ